MVFFAMHFFVEGLVSLLLSWFIDDEQAFIPERWLIINALVLVNILGFFDSFTDFVHA